MLIAIQGRRERVREGGWEEEEVGDASGPGGREECGGGVV